MEFELYDTETLLGVYYDPQFNQVSNYWLSTFFNQTINFEDEYVDFSKISEDRKLAPLVVPTAQGVPIYSAAEKAFRLKPAYLKPKDPVLAGRMVRRAAGLGEMNSGQPFSPMQRYQLVVADIMRQHRQAIERRWEWMAAEAILHGKITLEGEAYPETLVDFQRDAGHSIVKGPGTRWGDVGVSIVSDIEAWRDTCRKAKHGGPTSRLTVGADVWEVMRADAEVKALLDVNFRTLDSEARLKLGVREMTDVEFVGRLSATLDVYVYSDYYTSPSGVQTDFMSAKDVVLTGPNVQGVRCFGAILDKAAGLRALSVFPKMWDSQDPSATFILTQSAPLMVPVNPNNTLKATVLA